MNIARRTRPVLAAAALAAALGACAPGHGLPSMPAPETLPPGSPLASQTLAPWDAWLRHYMMTGQADSAVILLRGGAGPRDELVRRLQLAVVLHEAGRWRESNEALDWAEAETERRYTRSISQGAGALLVNDASIAYVPPPAERAMLPYYRMLNDLALGEAESAAVEGRRAGAYFTQLRDADGRQPCVGEGLVEYLAGISFGQAGAAQDALVSFRQAERAFDDCPGAGAPADLGARLYAAARRTGVAAVADSAARRYRLSAAPADTAAGEVVVMVQHGWVAHRSNADLHVPIFAAQADGLSNGDPAALVDLLLHTAENLVEQAQWGESWEEHPVQQVADALDGAYIMKLAWPVYRLESCSAQDVRVVIGGDTVNAPVAGDLSSAVLARWEGTRASALGRMMLRGTAKYLATRAIERKAEKEGGEEVGWLAGRLANFAGNRLERADTRSWSLLPDRVSVARISLHPGEHDVRIEVMGDDGETRWIDVGTVTVRAGQTSVVAQRVWGGEMGDLATRSPQMREAHARRESAPADTVPAVDAQPAGAAAPMEVASKAKSSTEP
ncbi:hypothetical protein [Longimicrobium terrae]|uniref:Lipoprotein n=1 Tax=Longimicrobium terrae TaxID=1639882 RepID=A0A841H1V0_9BACT|nr:hypothetical protein [Longimicrobium terrae]MBB4637708.1 hypothetical protein [Longimicrobium terrae]MBB6072105.1 hypothetical protein [Longimicrobium terrae]NNC29812.1 hypothetical protein [Longimicrobium terrae]